MASGRDRHCDVINDVPFSLHLSLITTMRIYHYSDFIMRAIAFHRRHDVLLNRLLRRKSKKNIKAPRHWPL